MCDKAFDFFFKYLSETAEFDADDWNSELGLVTRNLQPNYVIKTSYRDVFNEMCPIFCLNGNQRSTYLITKTAILCLKSFYNMN